MKFLIDVGNTRIKSAFIEEGRFHSYKACHYHQEGIDLILDSMLAEQAIPGEVVVASVAGEAISLHIRTYFAERCSAKLNFIETSHEAAGVTNAYADTSQLGVDRWLAMIAAWNQYKAPLCVVDFGTALTIDIISNDGLHQGGYIVPGLHLMVDSLDANTGQINMTSVATATNIDPGQNTESCIANGVMLTMTSLIEKAYLQLTKSYGSTGLCVLTGGDAERVMTSLNINVEHEPHLVLNGIAILIGETG